MKVFLTKIVALVLFVLGLISLVTPIPGAFIFLACSLTLTISVSTYAQYCVQWIRSRISWINRFLFWLEEKTGKRIKMIAETLPKTHPSKHMDNQKLNHKAYINKMQQDDNEQGMGKGPVD